MLKTNARKLRNPTIFLGKFAYLDNMTMHFTICRGLVLKRSKIIRIRSFQKKSCTFFAKYLNKPFSFSLNLIINLKTAIKIEITLFKHNKMRNMLTTNPPHIYHVHYEKFKWTAEN